MAAVIEKRNGVGNWEANFSSMDEEDCRPSEETYM